MKTQTVGEGPGALVVTAFDYDFSANIKGKLSIMGDGFNFIIPTGCYDGLAYGVELAERLIAWRDRTRPEDPVRAALAEARAEAESARGALYETRRIGLAMTKERDTARAALARLLAAMRDVDIAVGGGIGATDEYVAARTEAERALEDAR